jgi:hypothetical protein
MNDFVITRNSSLLFAISGQQSNRITSWEYDRALYKKRKKVERLFRRLKDFRRIFSRFEKLDVIFLAFLHIALIVEALRLGEHALVLASGQGSQPVIENVLQCPLELDARLPSQGTDLG